MYERRDQKTGAIFFLETQEERIQREMKEEYPIIKKALLLLLRKYPGPLPDDVQKFIEGGV